MNGCKQVSGRDYKDINLERTRPTKVFIDNKSGRQLAMNPVHHQCSWRIDI